MTFTPLLALRATERHQLLLDELERRWPRCQQDPDAVPEEPDWLVELVFDALENAGRFEDALRYLRLVPAARWGGGARHLDDLERVAELARCFEPVASLFALRGRVTTILAGEPRRIRLEGEQIELIVDLSGERVDVELAARALSRMHQKLKTRFGADPGALRVEVHGDEAAFRRRAEALQGRALPDHVHGLAHRAAGTLLVLHRPALASHPASLFVRLRHEYTHVAMASLAPGGRIPAWLDEGLAIALTSRLPRPMLELWDRAGHAARPVTLQDEALPLRQAARELACVQAESLARRLLERGDRFVADGLRAGWSTERWLGALADR
jgi:hypothetical protein